MTKQIKKLAFEYDSSNGMISSEDFVKNQVCNLISLKVSALGDNMIIPDDLIAKAEGFMMRNMKEETKYMFCARCLKAHMLKEAENIGLTKREKSFLSSLIEGEIGHNGYYLDGDELKKI